MYVYYKYRTQFKILNSNKGGFKNIFQYRQILRPAVQPMCTVTPFYTTLLLKGATVYIGVKFHLCCMALLFRGVVVTACVYSCFKGVFLVAPPLHGMDV